ncbi:DUF3307 domain-containing protein [Pedobacter yulinensis]|uniref:DUF3307 domain-containing protein n=1 Tax=Pedobacter yulinensis TaxID=2126353 RepID=A0A2T3HLI1_9SPHI|nr:DUF3307 domain-containing protein [Pedobacter yulinensis]PST83318.1 DUF3307 domain-containing protein [Pedobacter yulinensis]
MEIILIKLLLAHLLGDFVLQPNAWVADKERLKLASGKLYLHVALHIILAFVFLANSEAWTAALLIGIFHFVIDAAKLKFQKDNTKRTWFFIDQLLHLFTIAVVSWLYSGQPAFWPGFIAETKLWGIICAALFLTMPAATIIRVVIARWIPETPLSASADRKSLQDAGRFIGILERLLIYIFVLTGHFEAVGFLLAAKSIFRFGDLKEAQDIKLTEYVLIGTLLSFGIATVTGLLAAGLS